MMKQDVPNPPLMLPIINFLTSMPREGMLQVILGVNNQLERFLKVHPTKLVLILLNKITLLSMLVIVSLLLLWVMPMLLVFLLEDTIVRGILVINNIIHQTIISNNLQPINILDIIPHTQTIIRHLLL